MFFFLTRSPRLFRGNSDGHWNVKPIRHQTRTPANSNGIRTHPESEHRHRYNRLSLGRGGGWVITDCHYDGGGSGQSERMENGRGGGEGEGHRIEETEVKEM